MSNLNGFESLTQIVDFSVQRNIINLAKNFLTLLEKDKIYAQKLEKQLSEMGINEYNDSDANYKNGRKNTLDDSNNTIRELQNLISKFDFNFKNE